MDFLERLFYDVSMKKHTLDHEFLIGYIEGTDLKMCIYENEGTVPHFHLISQRRDFSCSIRIDSPEYFHHGNCKGYLNAEEKKCLKSFVEKNWLHIVHSWNAHNQDRIVKLPSRKVTNYSSLFVQK